MGGSEDSSTSGIDLDYRLLSIKYHHMDVGYLDYHLPTTGVGPYKGKAPP